MGIHSEQNQTQISSPKISVVMTEIVTKRKEISVFLKNCACGLGSVGAFPPYPCWFPTSPPWPPPRANLLKAPAVLKWLRLTGQVDDHPALLIGLGHAGLGSIYLSRHLLHLPKEQVGQTLKHDWLWSSADEPRAFVVPREKKIGSCLFDFQSLTPFFCLDLKPFARSWVGAGRLLVQM